MDRLDLFLRRVRSSARPDVLLLVPQLDVSVQGPLLRGRVGTQVALVVFDLQVNGIEVLRKPIPPGSAVAALLARVRLLARCVGTRRQLDDDLLRLSVGCRGRLGCRGSLSLGRRHHRSNDRLKKQKMDDKAIASHRLKLLGYFHYEKTFESFYEKTFLNFLCNDYPRN